MGIGDKDTIEKRQFTRLSFHSKMQLYSGTSAYTCEIIDISLKGLLFTKPENWNGKSKDNFRLTISISNSPSISMSIEIIHIMEDKIGAKWHKIDVASFSQLKRLLELNTTDKHRINKELSYLG